MNFQYLFAAEIGSSRAYQDKHRRNDNTLVTEPRLPAGERVELTEHIHHKSAECQYTEDNTQCTAYGRQHKAVAEIVKQYLAFLHTEGVESTYFRSLLCYHSLHGGDDYKECYGDKPANALPLHFPSA